MQTSVSAFILRYICNALRFLRNRNHKQSEAAESRYHRLSYIELLRYRSPMQVTEVVVYRNGDGYPICPRCDTAVEREYMNFCDRCGQRLGWELIDYAKEIPVPRHKEHRRK